jgi:cation:H+ antiporter
MVHGARELVQWMEATGAWAPWLFVLLFLLASLLMIWRLELMSAGGMEGTVLGTLIMPYCSGMGNLVFAFVLGAHGGPGREVLTNSLVNNVTNLTLLIGLPTIIWGLHVVPRSGTSKGKSKSKRRGAETSHQLHRLSLLLTITAAAFFTGLLWVLARDGRITLGDGLVLVGVFLFWQCFHVFDVLKNNVREKKSFSWKLPIDLLLLGIGAYGIYLSTDWLVEWLLQINTGFVSARHLGWLSGWLMVLPNALLAFYYAWRGNPEVVYASQVGDGHICIPLCVGIFALHHDIRTPDFFQSGMLILVLSCAFHFLMVGVFGRLPRWTGWLLVGAYAVFLHRGLIQ